jgi:hypothetical protein
MRNKLNKFENEYNSRVLGKDHQEMLKKLYPDVPEKEYLKGMMLFDPHGNLIFYYDYMNRYQKEN